MIVFLSSLVKWEGMGESLANVYGDGMGCMKGVPRLGTLRALQARVVWGHARLTGAGGSQGWRVPVLSQRPTSAVTVGCRGLQGAAEKREIQPLTYLVSLGEGSGQSYSVGGQAQRGEELWARGPGPGPGPGPGTGRSLLCVLSPSRGSSPGAEALRGLSPRRFRFRPHAVYKRKAGKRPPFRLGARRGEEWRWVPLRGAGPASPSVPAG